MRINSQLTIKAIFALLLCLLNILLVNSQTISYEKLDSISALVSKLQTGANGLSYNDGKTDYEISFPEENFQVAFSDQLATKTIYKKSNGKDVLYLTENIDLSQAISLEITNDKEVVLLKMTFPRGHIKTMLYEDGVFKNASDEDYLEFFCKTNDRKDVSASTDINHFKLFGLLAELSNRLKEEKGLITPDGAKALSGKWALLINTDYPQSITTYTKFLKDNPNTLYSAEAQKRLDAYNARKVIEDRRLSEAARAREKVFNLAHLGDQSYRNYASYGQADSLAGQLIKLYTESEIGAGKYAELKEFRPELQERYQWNKVYFQKRDQILIYDKLVANAQELNVQYMHKLNATVNGTVWLKASLLVLGGMATLAGAYAVLAKDDTFSPSERGDLLKYGGGSLSIGVIWTVLQGKLIKKSERQASSARKKADALKASIGQVVEKRTQSIGGRPLININ